MPRRGTADPLAAYRGRANAATGEAAEAAWVTQQLLYGAEAAWAKPGNSSRRFNRDVLGCWDTVAMTANYTVFSQVKATETDPWPPAPIWRARFLALPKPPGVRFLLAWLRPESTWQVWRLLGDGTRLAMDWPPVQTEREMR